MSLGFRSLLKMISFGWMQSFGSVRTQLILWNVVAISLLLGTLGIVCRYITFSFMIQSVDQELERGTEMFSHPPPSRSRQFEGDRRPPPGPGPQSPGGTTPRGMGGGGPPDRERPPRRPPDADNPLRPHIFNSKSEPAWPGDTRPIFDRAALDRALHGESVHTTVTYEGEPVRVFTTPGFTPQRERGAVQNAYSLKEVYRAIAGIDTALMVLVPVGLLGAWWMGSALTNRILRRVDKMAQAAASIGAEDFSQRLPVSGSDEFSELAKTFNGLLGRLDGTFQELKDALELQRRFTADASHELKTPLTVVKGSTSLALGRESTDEASRRTFMEIDDAANTMSHLVQDLLLLARSDSGQMGRDTIEMLVREVLETAKCQTASECQAPIELCIEPADLSVTGNEYELVRLFRNLLDNAVLYTPASGQITVSARKNGNAVEITVEDTGSGIAPEHLPHLGERFYRVDASRARTDGGTGLGLSICKSIVEAHGGSLTFESAPGKGTRACVVLPRNP